MGGGGLLEVGGDVVGGRAEGVEAAAEFGLEPAPRQLRLEHQVRLAQLLHIRQVHFLLAHQALPLTVTHI